MLFTKGSQQCGPFAPNFTKDMKRNFLGMLVILMSMATIRVSAQAFKFSGGLREMLSDPVMSVKLSAPTGERIDVIMKVTDSGQMAAVCADYGMTMKTDLGAIAVVSIPLDRLLAAAADERVVRIEREGGFRPCLDEARKTANVNPISEGLAPLPQAYSGKGVVVGVIDLGMQYDHPTFFDANGKTRFRKVWDYDDKDGQPVDVVLTNPDDIVARKYSYQTKYGLRQTNHAAHVAGIAAGLGTANVPYRGIAPESDIVYSELVTNPFAEDANQQNYTQMLTCVKNMMDYAKEQQQPVVINISSGCFLGFSSETKLLQEAFATLTGPGRIVVAAAGNGGDVEMCAPYFHSGKNLQEDIMFVGESMPVAYEILWKTAGALTLKFDVMIDQDSQSEEIATSQLVDGKIAPVERSLYKMSFLQLDDSPDGKHIYKLRLTPKKEGGGLTVSTSVVAEQSFEVFSYDIPITSVSPKEGCTLSAAYTSAVPSVFPNVIGVGNYCNRVLPNEYVNNPVTGEKETDVQTGMMDKTSSWGPTWDGRNKPDVSAPGSIISAGNWYYERNAKGAVGSYDIPGSDAKETWKCASGTSQASPVVAGIVALWLQAKPDLTPDDILNVIRKTSKAIEPIPNNHSGAGVIDAYAGLLEVLGLPTAIPELSLQQPEGVKFRMAAGRLYIDAVEDGTAVTIYNLSGVSVYEGAIGGGSVSLEGLPQGVYVVQIGKQGSTLIRL